MARATAGPSRTHSQILSTYRLQFHKGFPFSAGAHLAGYLAGLGISHVYASPILEARPGSQHGYDVVSYDRINPELGGEEGFRAMARAFANCGLGMILDIVPNHMAVGGDGNALWLDLLKHGPASSYADWFDVDFDSKDPLLTGKVHAPFLGDPYREVLSAGKIELVEDAARGGFALRAGEHLFPVRPEDDEEVRRRGIAAYGDLALLDGLARRQNYRLDWWRNASDRLNWRRFFEVTELAGIRMENPAAFDAAHRIAFELYGDGLIDGLRVDHVDGLSDPAAYCRQLRDRLSDLAPGRPEHAYRGPAWIIVEKILAPAEELPVGWGVDGTTGYDFMDQVSALQHDGAAERELAAHWSLVSARSPDLADEEHAARREVLEKGFEGQREYLVDRLLLLAEQAGHIEDIPRGAMRRAVIALIGNLRTYRTYVTGRSAAEEPGRFFDDALKAARLEPLADLLALDFIDSVMRGTDAAFDPAGRADAIRRFNQLSSPLAARAVEDTTFYRYGRLLSRNDVGFDAGSLAMSAQRFHDLMASRANEQPRSMLALATHDHKRGPDARARLAVLSEIPTEWRAISDLWLDLNASIRPGGLHAGDEYCFYQMLVGAWPLKDVSAQEKDEFADRMVGWWIKSLREAKLRTNWTAPNESYERLAESFVRSLLDRSISAPFLASIGGFVDRIAAAGAVKGLAQLVLQCTAPGIPDTYQGAEFWDFSGVDPDNRRRVDFEARKAARSSADEIPVLAASWRDGRLKQAILSALLRARRELPELFLSGSYIPLEITGHRRDCLIAFARRHGDRALVCVVPIRARAVLGLGSLAPAAEWRGDTAVRLPPSKGGWSPLWGTAPTSDLLHLRTAMSEIPSWVALSRPLR